MTKRRRTPQEEEAFFRSMTGLCNVKEDYASFDLIPQFFPTSSDYSARMETSKGPIWVMCHFGEPIEFDLLCHNNICQP